MLLDRAASSHANGGSLFLYIAPSRLFHAQFAWLSRKASPYCTAACKPPQPVSKTNNQEAPETGEPTFSGEHHGIRLPVLHPIRPQHPRSAPGRRARRAQAWAVGPLLNRVWFESDSSRGLGWTGSVPM